MHLWCYVLTTTSSLLISVVKVTATIHHTSIKWCHLTLQSQKQPHPLQAFVMCISKPLNPDWLDKNARRGFRNLKRQRLARKHGSRRWSCKGVLTRIFGQGIQRVFKKLPASAKAAVSGSTGVAVFDMIQGKRDLNWIPNDVDVFVALTPRYRSKPLKRMYAIMTEWLRSVEAQGFHYKLKRGGACYSKAMCIFDYECTNASDFPNLHLPKISFIGRPAKSVHHICREFDLPICGPIMRRRNQDSPIKVWITKEIRELFKNRCFYSKVDPTKATVISRRTRHRVDKYEEREFEFFHTDYEVPVASSDGEFPSFPKHYYRHYKPICKQFIITSLGREPTLQECHDFNIDPWTRHFENKDFTTWISYIY